MTDHEDLSTIDSAEAIGTCDVPSAAGAKPC